MIQNGIGDARFVGVWVVDRPVTIIMGSQWGDEGKGKVSLSDIWHYWRKPPPPLFDLKLVYSYVIEVDDSESEL